MNILGFEITRKKTAPVGLSIPDVRGGWYPVVREGFPGAWQQNIETPMADVLSHPTVFACITLIAGDIGKMRYELVERQDNDVWTPTERAAFSPFLKQPNGYQDPQQFREHWIISKLESGNTYVLKVRDDRGVFVQGYVLDPCRVRPLVAPDGSVFYELRQDYLSTQDRDIVYVPAREIIHDRFNCLFHPLVGISPLYAAGIPAILGLRIQTQGAHFFSNGSIPGGILTAPGVINQDKATEIGRRWEENYGGTNSGRVAVLGDGMKFEVIGQPADKSQLNEQWLSAAESIAVAFHVPFYLVGGPMPPYNNIQALNVQYYTQCIQPLATALENALDFGLGLQPERTNGVQLGVQFNLNDLLLMDTATQSDVIAKSIGSGVMTPNEGRALLNLLPVKGGDTPYLQQQYYSLAALDDRDAAPPTPTPTPEPSPTDEPPDDTQEPDDTAKFAMLLMQKAAEIATRNADAHVS